MAFFRGIHPENKETPPPKLQPVIDTFSLSILGCVANFSRALYASKMMAAMVTSSCDPTVERMSLL